MATPPPALMIQLVHGVCIALYLVASGAAVATLAGWLSWWWLPGELASHFRVQYLWVAVACTLALIVARRWRAAALAAVPALLNLSVILPLYWPSAAPPTDNPPLRIASINVFSGNRRHTDVLKFIADARPDVVLLMEVTSDWQDVFDALAADYPFQKTELRSDNFGIGLVSRMAWESATVHELGSTGPPAIVAHLDWHGAPLTLIGAHPFPPGLKSSKPWRLRNEQFNALATLCRNETDAVILFGDLNSTHWSAHWNTLLDGTRLRDSRLGFGVQASWPAWSPLPRIPIDHCLVSPEIAVRKRFIGPDVGSDHYPLVVDLTVNPGAGSPQRALGVAFRLSQTRSPVSIARHRESP